MIAESDIAEPEFIDEDDTALDKQQVANFSQAVLFSTDWTTETVINQLSRGNIEMNPRFQRRDAWSPHRKSLFIESIILGLPVPQIVLAEKKEQRGKYIVLDGKQRLLSLLQYTGQSATLEHNAFALTGLEARIDLHRVKFLQLETDPRFQGDLDSFLNHTLRTVVIRNWPSTEFLHMVFLRLNTGSVKLSPQELRQAVVPGEFSNYADDAAAESGELRQLLSRRTPDPRMRDVELLVRYLAIQNYLESYGGRMKSFLDESCRRLNDSWTDEADKIKNQVDTFKKVVDALIKIFGVTEIARKPGSRSFNRAIFDVLAFYASNDDIRQGMLSQSEAVKNTYQEAHDNRRFADAIESDTAGVPNTIARLEIWGDALRRALGLSFKLPSNSNGRIVFGGF